MAKKQKEEERHIDASKQREEWYIVEKQVSREEVSYREQDELCGELAIEIACGTYWLAVPSTSGIILFRLMRAIIWQLVDHGSVILSEVRLRQ